MPNIASRYASAVPSKNLLSRPETISSDSDVVAAVGLASIRHPLGAALLRLLVGGDNRASKEIAEILASKSIGKAYRMGLEVGRIEAAELAGAVLAWFRHKACPDCGGHGRAVIPGTKTLSDSEICGSCAGTGIRPLDVNKRHADLARWLVSEIERELAFAGPAAMAALAPRLDL